MSLTLITGGARSGKSRFAQELALTASGKVLFVATATAGDAEMAERIRKHRASRPTGWETLEQSQNLTKAIDENSSGFKVVLIDCITLLLNNIFAGHLDDKGELSDAEAAIADKECVAEIESLIGSIRKGNTHFIIVTNEVGEGIVPANKLSRIYRDVLGKMNQKLADEAGTVYLMVMGIPLRLKPALVTSLVSLA